MCRYKTTLAHKAVFSLAFLISIFFVGTRICSAHEVFDVIDESYYAGEIDFDTYVLYTAYALFDDPLLPESYRGSALVRSASTTTPSIPCAMPVVHFLEKSLSKTSATTRDYVERGLLRGGFVARRVGITYEHKEIDSDIINSTTVSLTSAIYPGYSPPVSVTCGDLAVLSVENGYPFNKVCFSDEISVYFYNETTPPATWTTYVVTQEQALNILVSADSVWDRVVNVWGFEEPYRFDFIGDTAHLPIFYWPTSSGLGGESHIKLPTGCFTGSLGGCETLLSHEFFHTIETRYNMASEVNEPISRFIENIWTVVSTGAGTVTAIYPYIEDRHQLPIFYNDTTHPLVSIYDAWGYFYYMSSFETTDLHVPLLNMFTEYRDLYYRTKDPYAAITASVSSYQDFAGNPMTKFVDTLLDFAVKTYTHTYYSHLDTPTIDVLLEAPTFTVNNEKVIEISPNSFRYFQITPSPVATLNVSYSSFVHGLGANPNEVKAAFIQTTRDYTSDTSPWVGASGTFSFDAANGNYSANISGDNITLVFANADKASTATIYVNIIDNDPSHRSINGIVFDSFTGVPLENVRITVASSTVSSNASGTFNFFSSTPVISTHVVNFSKAGYSTETKNIELTAGEPNQAIAVEMSPTGQFVLAGKVQTASGRGLNGYLIDVRSPSDPTFIFTTISNESGGYLSSPQTCPGTATTCSLNVEVLDSNNNVLASNTISATHGSKMVHNFTLLDTGFSGSVRLPDGTLMEEPNNIKIKVQGIAPIDSFAATYDVTTDDGRFMTDMGIATGTYDLYIIEGSDLLNASNRYVTLASDTPYVPNVQLIVPWEISSTDLVMPVRDTILSKSRVVAQAYPANGQVTWQLSLSATKSQYMDYCSLYASPDEDTLVPSYNLLINNAATFASSTAILDFDGYYDNAGQKQRLNSGFYYTYLQCYQQQTGTTGDSYVALTGYSKINLSNSFWMFDPSNNTGETAFTPAVTGTTNRVVITTSGGGPIIRELVYGRNSINKYQLSSGDYGIHWDGRASDTALMATGTYDISWDSGTSTITLDSTDRTPIISATMRDTGSNYWTIPQCTDASGAANHAVWLLDMVSATGTSLPITTDALGSYIATPAAPLVGPSKGDVATGAIAIIRAFNMYGMGTMYLEFDGTAFATPSQNVIALAALDGYATDVYPDMSVNTYIGTSALRSDQFATAGAVTIEGIPPGSSYNFEMAGSGFFKETLTNVNVPSTAATPIDLIALSGTYDIATTTITAGTAYLLRAGNANDDDNDSRRFSMRRQTASSVSTSSFVYPYATPTEWIYDTDFFIGHFGEIRNNATPGWATGGATVDVNTDGVVDHIDLLMMKQVFGEASDTLGIACPPGYCPETCIIDIDLYAENPTLTCAINDPSCNKHLCARHYSDGTFISWKNADADKDGKVDIVDFGLMKPHFNVGHGDNARPGFEKANVFRKDTPTYPASDVVDISDFVMIKEGYKRCVDQSGDPLTWGPGGMMCQLCDNDPGPPINDCGW